MNHQGHGRDRERARERMGVKERVNGGREG